MTFTREDLLDGPLFEENLVSFDIETTGSLLGSGRVIEIAAVKFTLDGSFEDHFEQLIDPMMPIRPDYTAIHGITDSMVEGKPKIGEAVKGFIEFIGEDTTLVAHNANFDVSFLSLEMARHDISPPGNPIFDSLALSRQRLPGLKRYKLISLSEYLEIDQRPKHRALPDSLAVASLVVEICKRSECFDLASLIRGIKTQRFSRGSHFEYDLPEHLSDIAHSLKKGFPLVIRYKGGSKGTAPRLVTPFFILEKETILYMSAFCHTDGVEKCFRLDRVKEARVVEA